MVLIGAGRIGLVHLVNLVANKRVNLVAIVEPDARGKVQCYFDPAIRLIYL
jgi:hypothetical protein